MKEKGTRSSFGGIEQSLFSIPIFAIVLVLLLSQIFNRETANTEMPLKQTCAPEISNSFKLVMLQSIFIK